MCKWGTSERRQEPPCYPSLLGTSQPPPSTTRMGTPLHLFKLYNVNVPGCARKFTSMLSSLFLQKGKLRPKEFWKLNDYTVAIGA